MSAVEILGPSSHCREEHQWFGPRFMFLVRHMMTTKNMFGTHETIGPATFSWTDELLRIVTKSARTLWFCRSRFLVIFCVWLLSQVMGRWGINWQREPTGGRQNRSRVAPHLDLTKGRQWGRAFGYMAFNATIHWQSMFECSRHSGNGICINQWNMFKSFQPHGPSIF
jgi:hypothetical protein